MVKGLDKFRGYFKDFPDSYVIIGGTACDIIIGSAGLTARTTKDIDIILIVEVLTKDFIKQVWKFIQDAQYESMEKSAQDRKYYRFTKPQSDGFPYQLELFSRNPDFLDLPEAAHFTPISVSDDLSSLSAILMNDDYYHFTLSNSSHNDNVHLANTDALICLKAKAYLDLLQRRKEGEKIDEKDIKKHKADVFRLAALLPGDYVMDVPGTIKKDMQIFAETVKNELPDKAIFKEMGIPDTDVNALFDQLVKNFKLI